MLFGSSVESKLPLVCKKVVERPGKGKRCINTPHLNRYGVSLAEKQP